LDRVDFPVFAECRCKFDHKTPFNPSRIGKNYNLIGPEFDPAGFQIAYSRQISLDCLFWNASSLLARQMHLSVFQRETVILAASQAESSARK